MMSGYADETYASQSRKAGFDEYMVKPVDPDLLCERMAKILSAPRSHAPR